MTAVSPADGAAGATPAGYGAKGRFAAASVRALIVDGTLPPGTQVRQDQVASRIGMTRVPVREALKTLTAEGLLEHRANLGHFVRVLDVSGLSQIIWMRDTFENELARTMAWPDVDESAELVRLAAECRASLDGTVEDFIRAEEMLHKALWRLSPESLVFEEAARMWALLAPYRHLMDFSESRMRATVAEHETILAAIDARDRDALCAAIEDHHRHLRRARDRVANDGFEERSAV